MLALCLIQAVDARNIKSVYEQPQAQVTKTLFTPYDDGQTALLQFLDTAKTYVHIAIFGFTNPLITDKLIELHSRGVTVELLLDRSQSNGSKQKEQIARLRQAGIECLIGTSSRRHQLSHVKFIVIDGTRVENGSYNFSPSANFQNNNLNFVESSEYASLFESEWQRIKAFMIQQQEESQSGGENADSRIRAVGRGRM